jgi:hypothetical protein
MYGLCYRVFRQCNILPNRFILSSGSARHNMCLFCFKVHFPFYLPPHQPTKTIELVDNIKSLRGAKSKGRLLKTTLDASEFLAAPRIENLRSTILCVYTV